MTNSGGGGTSVKFHQDEMNAGHQGRLGARHLPQIQEESYSREHSTCGLPPIVRWQPTGSPGVEDTDKQEVMRPSDPASPALYEQQKKMEENRSLLEELGCIKAESLCLNAERQREAEFLRQQENKLLRTNLCYLSLSRRITKPSYFRKFPMHIYCLPVQAVSHRARRRGLTKRK